MMIQIELAKNNNWLKENGYDLASEEEIYDKQLLDIIANPRWYLDNIEFLIEYRVSWKSYAKNKTPTLPLRYINRGKPKDL